jgi:hypothetical protein
MDVRGSLKMSEEEKERHIPPVTTRRKIAKKFVYWPFHLLVPFILDCECL